MYRLKTENGKVKSLLRSGKDFVRNTIPVSSAQHIIDNGERVESTVEGYPICVDNQWFFEGVEMEEKPTPTAKKGGRKHE